MCIIAHTAKKKYMPRANVEQCMKSNSAGFFMAELRQDGTRRTIRTMSQEDALKFFDECSPDNGFVLHARIPSYGETNLDNVHGREQDGIIFMHNMTLRELDGMMKEDGWKKTDSEYFFRHIFMPLFNVFGKDAYRDGKLNPYIDKLVKFFAGSTNRFLFIMPDNVVLKYGTSGWTKDFGGNCEFSNQSYRIPSYTQTCQRPASWNYSSAFACDYDDDGFPVAYDYDREYDGEVFLKTIGAAGIVDLALHDLVIGNVADLAQYSVPSDATKGVKDAMSLAIGEIIPTAFSDDTREAAAELIGVVGSQSPDDKDDKDVYNAIVGYAAALESTFAEVNHRKYGIYPSDAKNLVSDTVDQINVAAAFLNIGFNETASDPKEYATAFSMSRTKKGGFKMERVDPIDIFCPEGLAADVAFRGFREAMKLAAKKTEEPGKEAKTA